MKKVIIVFTLLTIFCGEKILAQTTNPDELVVPLSNPGKPYTLKVGLVSGSITVSASTGKDIIIDVKSDGKAKGEMTTADNGMKKISKGSSYGVTAKEDDNIVNVSTDNPNEAVFLTLKIPQDVKLKLSTVNDGDITVNNIKGELEINNVNGAITLNNISGSVVASTINGDVITTFTTVDSKAPMAFSSLNGNVDVTFPSGAQYNMKLKSDRGEIYTDFDIAVDKTESKVSNTNHSGMYELKKDDWITGKINGGGPEVLMKNMEGNIYIRKAKG
ncbi:MAG TPA: hypothetical protein VHZ50_11700 [Puia sp.]|jgi:hypothetical protein|nr:hypothetical protein [Puia sp.]